MTKDSFQTVVPHYSTPQRYEAASLRRAGPQDLSALTALYHQARDGGAETRETMASWLDRGGSLVLQDADGTLLCALRWREGHEGWEVDRVATLPRARGQNYGRWLMTKLEALAIRSNIPTLSLTLEAPEGDLLAYYQRMGYRVTAQDASRVALQKRVGGMWQYKGRSD